MSDSQVPTGADLRVDRTVEQPQEEQRHEEGRENSHLNIDAKDQKSIANKLEQAKAEEKREEEEANQPAELPTAAARANGNEPSRGAKVDEQIMLEEEAELRRKGKLD